MDYKSRHIMWGGLLIVCVLGLDALLWYAGELLHLSSLIARLSVMAVITLFAIAALLWLQKKRYLYLNAFYNAEKPFAQFCDHGYDPESHIKVLQKQFRQAPP